MKNKKKFSFLNFLTIVLCAICFTALSYPFIANLLSQQQMTKVIQTYSQNVSELQKTQIQKMLADAQAYNNYLYQMSEFGSTTLQKPDYNKLLTVTSDGVMAYIDIPQIGIRGIPIYHGDSEGTLLKGIGHIPQSSLPIGDANSHTVLSGHSGRADNTLFTNINKLKIGDVFYLHTLNLNLKYKINDIEVVAPQDEAILNIEKGKDVASLVTCYPPGINSERLVVSGERIPYNEQLPQEKINRNPYDYRFWLITGSSLLAVLGLSYLLIKSIRKGERRLSKKENE